MRYSQVVPVVFGAGVVKKTGKHTKALGCGKVLLVSDEMMISTPGYAACKQSLAQAGIAIVEFSKCLPDPPIELCEEAGALAVAEQVDGIVAFGGGSVMDTAKAVSILSKNPAPLDQYLAKEYKPGVPAILIPTTAGTGSEVTAFAVVSDTVHKSKLVMMAQGALGIVDPELTLSVPPSVTANTGMDVFAHSAEAIIGNMHNPKSDALSVEAIHRIVRYLPVAVRDGQNRQAREHLSIASNFAGIAFNDSWANLGHDIAHKIGAVHHVPHGAACALALPEVMAWSARYVPDAVRMIGEAMGLTLDGETGVAIGQKVADAMRQLMREIRIPSCADLKITVEQLLPFAEELLSEHINDPGAALPHTITRDELEAILAAIAENY